MSTRTLFITAATAVLSVTLLGCGGDKTVLAREAEGYDVITEGTAPGVTGTLGGAAIPPAVIPSPELTGTNLDTTTAFTTLDPVLGVPQTQPDLTVGDALELPPGGYSTTPSGVASPPRAAPSRPEPARPASTPAPRYEEPRSTPTPGTSPTIDIRRSAPAPTPTATPRVEPSPDPEPEPEPEPESEPEPDPEPTDG